MVPLVSSDAGILLLAVLFLLSSSPDRGRASQDSFRLARMTDAATLDPAIASSLADWEILFLLFRPLLDVRGGTELYPEAAERWQVSPDARTLTFHLRPGERFSDGRPVVAEDYRYAIERIADPRTASWIRSYIAGIRGVEAFTEGRTNRIAGVAVPAPDTLVIELSAPDLAFPYTMGLIGFPLPREHVERADRPFREFPVGNGPYRLREWKRGLQMSLEPNPHFTTPRTRRFNRIEVTIGGDETTHLMMFERGELDLPSLDGASVPLSSRVRLERDPRWGPLIERVPGVNITFVSMNVEMPPLDNVKVRQALNYAIDRPRRMLTANRLFVAARGIIPPWVPGHNPSLVGYGHDPDKARRLLAESGVTLPLRLELWYPNDQINQIISEGLQADLHDVGVELELRPATINALGDLAGTRGRIHMSLGDWNPGADPRDFIATMLDGRIITNSPTMNTSFYNNPEVNRLLDEAAQSADMPSRFALYQRAEAIIVDDAPWIFLGHKYQILLRQPWLKGPILEAGGILRLDRAWKE